MRIGRLGHRIQIQENQYAASDAHGNPVPTWTTIATVWADVMPLSGRELLLAQQVNATTTHSVRIRYLSTVRPDQRIVHQGRYFDINGIANDRESDRMQLLQCTENATYESDFTPVGITFNDLQTLSGALPILGG